MGRMLEAEDLYEALVAFVQPKPLSGRHVLLTAGPTFESIDPVRGVTNLSSGKMGYALARALAHAGARVTMVSGPVALPVPAGVDCVPVRAALEMHAAVMSRVDDADVFIGVAAVADYRPRESRDHKLKKSAETLQLALVPNPDILAEVAARPSPPFCVGFAAESRDLDHYAIGKLETKRLDMVVGNLVQVGLGGDQNEVVIFDRAGRHPVPRDDKRRVAVVIVEHLAAALAAR